ncbi:MAG: sterol desaturase family protein [Alphaproteobacteria bacterium]|jgi:sterol desaturase/sphingolipid hydroxylase (fatty acid hydroxylase superfamily)|nr:sterol desaturase family protein [Rhodospirillaceae bacterium]MDG2481941.1 sterol desaturase family protein [Alphaproteobacteria bacterium]MBT6206027.1 sterol desaturase family protein [Rhodospirillaceae bacterium]MBT6512953.1 sterol desaturase family protein [Rhodospirillaceae bacterium]MBT7614145.1 sterol desaturase family protein [Rhodospirillaceae bacterium]
MPDGVDAILLFKLLAFGVMVALFVQERVAPLVPQPRDGQRLARNLSLWGGNIVLSLIVIVPLTSFAASNGLGWRPVWWSGAVGLVFDLLLLDLWIYGWHRANHVVPFLWRFHQVHHRDQALDVSTAVRFHPGEVMLSALVRAGVIVLLAMPLSTILLFEAIVLVAAAFQHSNIRLRPAVDGFLARLVITPGIHWVHHHDRRADTDSNYGTVLSVWDRLFSSLNPTKRSVAMTLGVEGAAELPLAGLAVLPFESQR